MTLLVLAVGTAMPLLLWGTWVLSDGWQPDHSNAVLCFHALGTGVDDVLPPGEPIGWFETQANRKFMFCSVVNHPGLWPDWWCIATRGEDAYYSGRCGGWK